MAFTISKPALLAAISYAVMGFIILLPFNSIKSDGSIYTPSFSNRIIILILMIIPFALSIYSINCMIVGKCFVWSWVQSTTIALWTLLFILASFLTQRESYQNKR